MHLNDDVINPMPKSLSDTGVRNAKPKSKPYTMPDGGGLYLLITPYGGKQWQMYYFFARIEKILAVGVYPEVSLSDARERCALAWKVLEAGGDPDAVMQEAKQVATPKSVG